MIEVALVAIVRKDSYLRARYFKLKSKIGANKAVVAIAHKLFQAVYRAVKEDKEYRELGADYVSLNQVAKDLNTLTRIKERLGKDAVMALIDQISPDKTE